MLKLSKFPYNWLQELV